MHDPQPRRRALQTLLAGALCPAGVVGPASAAGNYPARPVRIVTFGTPGGPIDAIARHYGEHLKRRWGQAVIVESKPGASGLVAADLVAKAPPDGHTLILTLSLTHTTVPLLKRKPPYDPVRDFQPLVQVASGGPMLVVAAATPADNLRAFVDWAKAKGRATYGTWGIGSGPHLYGELLKRQTGAPLDHVPYKSESAAHLDLFGGLLDAAWSNPATARGHLLAGKIKVLGITGTRRVGTLPEVPSFAEQGFDGYLLESWVGFLAPAGTPAPVVDKLAEALRDITRTPGVHAKLLDLGFEPLGNTPQAFAAAHRAELPQWAALIEQAGVTVD